MELAEEEEIRQTIDLLSAAINRQNSSMLEILDKLKQINVTLKESERVMQTQKEAIREKDLLIAVKDAKLEQQYRIIKAWREHSPQENKYQ